MKASITCVLTVALFLLLVGGTPSQALLISTELELNFIVDPEQSLWGSGGANDFGTSGSADVGGVGFSYNTSADSGTVSASFTGDLLIDYTSTLLAPGTTSLGLSFPGDTGGVELHSQLGADLKVTASALGASIDIINENYLLKIDKNDSPAELNQQISGKDSVTVGNSGMSLGLFKVGADYDIEQTDKFEATAIDGTLAYSLSGSSMVSLMSFTLDTNMEQSFNLELDQIGTWDFWFVDIMLDNLFSTSFDAELVIYEEHYVPEICYWYGIPYPCGHYDRNELTLADLDLYNGSPFALDFNPISYDSALFSIEVGTTPDPVPEPSTILLLGCGLAGLAFYRRREKK